MSSELSDCPTDAHTPTRTRGEPPAVPASVLDAIRARLRVAQYLRPGQLAVLAALLAVVGILTVAPPALTGFLGLFVGTVALLVVAPYVAVRLATDGGR